MPLLKNLKIKALSSQAIFIVLIAVIIGGTAYFIYQYRSLRDYKKLWIIAEKEKQMLKVELEQLRNKYQTIDALFQEKESLLEDVDSLKTNFRQLEQLLKQTQIERDSLKQELAQLRENMRLLEGKIHNLSEVDLAVEFRLKSIRQLRKAARQIKREIHLAKVKARKELDKIKLELGNRGYVIKEGRSTLTAKRAIELEKIVVQRSQAGVNLAE